LSWHDFEEVTAREVLQRLAHRIGVDARSVVAIGSVRFLPGLKGLGGYASRQMPRAVRVSIHRELEVVVVILRRFALVIDDEDLVGQV
jgi:hypothetical protein